MRAKREIALSGKKNPRTERTDLRRLYRIFAGLLIIAALLTAPAAAEICWGLADTDPQVCSGHGTCAADDICSCTEGWTGA